ncbi:MAG: asparagine synthase (glutamine-hydrolyzing) [Desulfobacteraceae bacterium]|nr:asparagine synthase (glutamine-hydrolyzing) [Desulfobacteraceae bacterium]MCF8095700.1 asparagine synthase (glutamine-hydrolyzing) [Desulfobacteraceae bacterium]
MCGISGIISETVSGGRLKQKAAEMCSLQGHRGPDARDACTCEGSWGRAAFGFVRLAILDLETGMQPIKCPVDDTVILCNGQIYNYIELRPQVEGEPFVSRGDIEVALHLYRKKGIRFIEELNGMYAGAILDPVRKKLFLFRDRFGIKPLYYVARDKEFAFSSEIRPLFKALDITPEVNEDRLSTYFIYRYVPGGQTLFKDVMRVPPGSYLEYDLESKTFEVRRYWQYHAESLDKVFSLDEAADEFFGLFQDAVDIRLRADVELGSFISGGIDSSSVAAAAAKTHPEMKLYTATFDEPAYDELPDVRRFLNYHSGLFSQAGLYPASCGKEALEDLPDIIAAIEEPISLGTILPTDRICSFASRDVKAVLTGEGADEIFAGYRKFMLEAAAEEYRQLSWRMKDKMREWFPELEPYLARRSGDPVQRYIQTEALFDESELDRLLGRQAVSRAFPEDAMPELTGKEHPVNAAIAFETRCRLPDYVVLRLDKLSMRHSLETRTPLLDYRLAEFAARLPLPMKLNLSMNREKFICSYAFVRHGLLDAKTAFRKKQPFTFPVADWLSDTRSLPESVREVLFGDIVKRHNMINPAFVRKLAERVTASGVGPQTLVSEADRLFSIIVFTLWYEKFIYR